jgi:methyltransferase FkbM-like protein
MPTACLLRGRGRRQIDALIDRTLALNGVTSGVDVECAILTAILRKGSASFIVAEDFWNSRLSETEFGIEVPAVSLNERLRSRAVTFLIVDIEGGEVTLFDGVDLSSVRAMFVEMHVEIIGKSGMQKLIDRFQEQGFEYRSGLFLRTEAVLISAESRPGCRSMRLPFPHQDDESLGAGFCSPMRFEPEE